MPAAPIRPGMTVAMAPASEIALEAALLAAEVAEAAAPPEDEELLPVDEEPLEDDELPLEVEEPDEPEESVEPEVLPPVTLLRIEPK